MQPCRVEGSAREEGKAAHHRHDPVFVGLLHLELALALVVLVALVMLVALVTLAITLTILLLFSLLILVLHPTLLASLLLTSR